MAGPPLPDARSQPLAAALIEDDEEAEEILSTGTPQEKAAVIAEKIVEGGMRKFYEEVALLEQPFVMDDKKSVGEFARENGFEIKSYLKFEVGALA